MNRSDSQKPVTLDQLIALCAEMRALARTGVPMEKNMLQMAAELPSELGRIAAEIGERGDAGESLEQIIESDQLQLPPVFKAVVAAGIRSGHLSVALEGMATTARRMAELRRSIIQASIYPLIVLVVISGLCLLVLSRLSEAYVDATVAQNVDSMPVGMGLLSIWGNWSWLVTLAALLLFFVWFVVSARASFLQSQGFASCMMRLPWTHKLLRLGRLAIFTDVLSLLLEQEIPLPESLRLAGEASGDEPLHREAVLIAESLERGEEGNSIDESQAVIPTLLRWQLMAQKPTPQLVKSLRTTSYSQQRRANQLADLLAQQLPVILTIGVGGGATLLYAMAVMGPWYSLLTSIAEQNLAR